MVAGCDTVTALSSANFIYFIFNTDLGGGGLGAGGKAVDKTVSLQGPCSISSTFK